MAITFCNICRQRLIRSRYPSCFRYNSTRAEVRGNVIDELESRGMVASMTSRALRSHTKNPATVYLGVDPSARSLHVGNLLALIGLLHFRLAGHNAIALIGGATGSVGDPSGRSSERKALSQEELTANAEGITRQVTSFFRNGLPFALKRLKRQLEDAGGSDVRVMNNLQWLGGVGLLDFLGTVGRHARVSVMLSRDSVRSRLSSASGISFTEFTYQLLQAYDFACLHEQEGCTVQLGGSDQLGNIMSGIDLIRRRAIMAAGGEVQDADLAGKQEDEGVSPAYGLTMPLLTTSSGEKFGKSAGNAVWLDESLTPAFEFYQFFLRLTDVEVTHFLKFFTFAPLSELSALIAEHQQKPDLRKAQKYLASEVTELVHGEQGLRKAMAATSVLFDTSDLSSLRADDIVSAFDSPGSSKSPLLVRLPPNEVLDQKIISIAVASGASPSKSQARQILLSGGLYLNNQRVTDVNRIIRPEDLLDDRVVVLRVGKGGHKVVVVER